MMPKILEYDKDSRRVKVTAEAYAIPDLKAIIDKYDDPEPYLSYIYSMTAPDSPYINIPDEEKEEAVLYDVQMTLGEFDSEDKLVAIAIKNLQEKYSTPLTRIAKEIGSELERWRKLLSSQPVTMNGRDSNFEARSKIVEKISKYATEYQKVMKMAQDELQVATKGEHELGEY